MPSPRGAAYVGGTGCLAGLLLFAAGALAAGDADEGRAVAERICKRCHVIGADNLHGSIGSTPSFFLMKDKLDDYRQRLFSLKQRRPHKAQDFELSYAEAEHLIAYISTLERP
jgi:mono/diheme cytochrome c family protein